MMEQLEKEFSKKITKLPDGRQLIYYNFTSEAGTVLPNTGAQPQKEER
jgi:hypothetical protein